jgi:hypothetical protein
MANLEVSWAHTPPFLSFRPAAEGSVLGDLEPRRTSPPLTYRGALASGWLRLQRWLS